MRKPEEISASILRGDLAETLDEVRFHEKLYVITKHGKKVAMLVPIKKKEEPPIQTPK